MNTSRVYKNTEGKDRTIHQMVRDEPDWAASRIQAGESAIAELAMTHRALTLELQQHKRCHAELLRLAERLRKYEPGSPMILNSGEK